MPPVPVPVIGMIMVAPGVTSVGVKVTVLTALSALLVGPICSGDAESLRMNVLVPTFRTARAVG